MFYLLGFRVESYVKYTITSGSCFKTIVTNINLNLSLDLDIGHYSLMYKFISVMTVKPVENATNCSKPAALLT